MADKRLNKILQEYGIASRRKADLLIESGEVMVNGKVVTQLGSQYDTENDHIKVYGKLLNRAEAKVYMMLNKPKGVVCSNQRMGDEMIVSDLFKKRKKSRLFTVGRLDMNTTGLLLLTNDGDFSNEVIHPSSNVKKVYQASVSETITYYHIASMMKGVYIDRTLVKPIKIQRMRRRLLQITLMEGKKHEVRLLVQKAGLPLVHLKRIRIGGLTIGSLEEGAHRLLTKKDREMIFSREKFNKSSKS